MELKNTKKEREIRQVAATMAVSGMPLSSGFVRELEKVAGGEKTSEELRREVIGRYKKEP